MHISAWIDPQGVGGAPIISNIDPTPYEWKSYPEALTDAGVSWQVDQEVDNTGPTCWRCSRASRTRRRHARPASGRLLAHPYQLPVRAPGLHGRGRRRLRRQQDQRDRRWIASDAFDHTSVLQFLEELTGVTIPNITPWRRSTFGDLTSAFGFPEFPSAVPRLPGTKAALARAAVNVNTLPAPVFPGASQTPPVQQTGPRPRPRTTSRDI